MRSIAYAFFLWGWLVHPQLAIAEKLHTALVLAVDVSGSVSNKRWDVQRLGYARAFRHEDVIAALLHRPTAISLAQWSECIRFEQTIPWTRVTSREQILQIADAMERQERVGGMVTCLAGALLKSARLFDSLPWVANRKIIDIPGDGSHNEILYVTDFRGPVFERERLLSADLRDARDQVLKKGIAINGLPIMVHPPDGDANLTYIVDYYCRRVVGNPDPGLEPICEVVSDGDDFEAFIRALWKKLTLELLS
jgi:hypothetical protein